MWMVSGVSNLLIAIIYYVYRQIAFYLRHGNLLHRCQVSDVQRPQQLIVSPTLAISITTCSWFWHAPQNFGYSWQTSLRWRRFLEPKPCVLECQQDNPKWSNTFCRRTQSSRNILLRALENRSIKRGLLSSSFFFEYSGLTSYLLASSHATWVDWETP